MCTTKLKLRESCDMWRSAAGAPLRRLSTGCAALRRRAGKESLLGVSRPLGRPDWRRLPCPYSASTFVSLRGLRSASSSSSAEEHVQWSRWIGAAAATLGGASVALYALQSDRWFGNRATTAECDAPPAKGDGQSEAAEAPVPGKYRADLPTVRATDVSKHKTSEDRIWVSYLGGVYDITEFVENHPGGPEKIMLAAGGSIAPFWALYMQHQEEYVYEMLEGMRVANLDERDQEEERKKAAADPYKQEPPRSPSLIIRSLKPFNAEVPLEQIDSELTPNELFYVRNHLPVPRIDPKEYRLEIVGRKGEHLQLSLDDLRQKFPAHNVTSTVMCAGNRRNEMDRIKKVKGGYWDAGAISTARWTGALLSDVLEHAGIKEEELTRHIHFVGLDEDKTQKVAYGASIPAEFGFDPNAEVLLAYEMNGELLPRDHGYPVRAIVPGIVGARNVKWLGKVVVAEEESKSHWQQNDYKGFNPSVDWDTVDFSTAPAIQELPVISAICEVEREGSFFNVRGYAYSGGGRGVIRVDVTADEGATWTSAQLTPGDASQKRNHVYAWTLWQTRIPVPDGAANTAGYTLHSRAVDSQYNVQPERTEHIWNLRGVLSNSWHRRVVESAA